MQAHDSQNTRLILLPFPYQIVVTRKFVRESVDRQTSNNAIKTVTR